MPDALVVEFAVRASAAHAFRMWTARCALWWPPAHTLSGDPAAIVFEPRAGGRIYERGPDGVEHPWGEVVEWSPPGLLRYRWHLFFTPEDATDVAVRFTEHDGGTLVRIDHGGWERLGPAGPARRERTGTVWAELGERFARAVSGPRGAAGR